LRETDDPTAAPGVNATYHEEVLWYSLLSSGWIDAILTLHATPGPTTPDSTPALLPVGGLPAWRELTAGERRARLNLVAAFRRLNVVMSPAEVANVIDGDGVIVNGYPVHITDNGYSYPLSGDGPGEVNGSGGIVPAFAGTLRPAGH